jgi:anti-sigma factor RsiW
MRCREARTAIAERGWGALPPARRAALDAHLPHCAACAAVERDELRLLDDLAGLRTELPFDVEVTRSVLNQVTRLGPVVREEVPASQLGWAAAIAVAATAGLSVAFFGSMPSYATISAQIQGLAGAAARVVLGGAEVLWTLLAVSVKLLGVALQALGALAPVLEWIQPAAATTVLLCCLAMTTTIFTVLWRDWNAHTPALLDKEH